MNRQTSDKTTKVGAGTEEIDLKTASPTGHEEVEAHIARESKGNAEVPPKLKADHDGQKPEEPEQPLNPRRPQNSRPD